MALLVYFNQIRNSPTEVEYQFGATRENLSRTVTIDKATRTVHTTGPEDAMSRIAAGQIIRRAAREKTWPQNGVIAS